MSAPRYGLRYFDGPREIRLMQIGGSGRVKLSDGNCAWWEDHRPLLSVHWQVYETEIGQTYSDRKAAEMVSFNLKR
jgi:hypothetical protein